MDPNDLVTLAGTCCTWAGPWRGPGPDASAVLADRDNGSPAEAVDSDKQWRWGADLLLAATARYRSRRTRWAAWSPGAA